MDKMVDNDNRDLIEMDRRHVWHHLSQHKKYETADPMLMVEGRGMRVWDAAGREYLDAVSGGVWTVNVGYGRESIANAVRDQLARINFFSHSAGSEANEKVYKMVRQMAHARHGGGKYKILYRERDYHGTTITALSSGGQDERNAQYGPMTPGFVQVPHCLEYRRQYADGDYAAQCAAAIEEIIQREGPETIGAMVLEPVTAGGGVILPPDGYWPRVQELCRKYDILLHIDEVVCGFGRAGAWFAYQDYGIEPDFVTMAKGVASGYAAIGCMVTTEEIFARFKDRPDDPMNYFRDISTFGGCTAGPAAALENMRIIEEENLVENSRKTGAHLLGLLHGLQARHGAIGDVRGKGLFIGAELETDRASKQPAPEAQVQAVVANCMRQGVIVGATNRSLAGFNNTLLLAPPLICTEKDAEQIAGAIDKALAEEFAGSRKAA